MIESAIAFVALLLLIAGGLFTLERSTDWRLFRVLPPIVLIYLLVTLLAVLGTWQATTEIQQTQKLITSRLLPALLFLLLTTCDLRAILALGPRMLGAFACATGTILLAFVIVYATLGRWLPTDAPASLATLSGSWTGGTANLLAVKQAIGLPESALSQVLLTDAVCYSVWVLTLFSAAPFAARFNHWSGARDLTLTPAHGVAPIHATPDVGGLLLWFGISLLVGSVAAQLASLMPTSNVLSPTSWTLLLVTAAGLLYAHTPLARLPGSSSLASALLAIVVAAMASQSNFDDLASAPRFLLAGFCVLGVHAVLMLIAAKIFRFDLFTCSVCSLANIGGPASAPLLAAMYSPVLVPIGILLAMLGYVFGTGLGIGLASVLTRIAAMMG